MTEPKERERGRESERDTKRKRYRDREMEMERETEGQRGEQSTRQEPRTITRLRCTREYYTQRLRLLFCNIKEIENSKTKLKILCQLPRIMQHSCEKKIFGNLSICKDTNEK